jgi:hypothetical protein
MPESECDESLWFWIAVGTWALIGFAVLSVLFIFRRQPTLADRARQRRKVRDPTCDILDESQLVTEGDDEEEVESALLGARISVRSRHSEFA